MISSIDLCNSTFFWVRTKYSSPISSSSRPVSVQPLEHRSSNRYNLKTGDMFAVNSSLELHEAAERQEQQPQVTLRNLPYSTGSDDTRQSGHFASKTATKKQTGAPSRHFMTVTLLMVNAVFCWTPVNVAYALQSWRSYQNPTFFAVSQLIYFMDALLNPLIYPLAAQEWRDAFRRMLRMWQILFSEEATIFPFSAGFWRDSIINYRHRKNQFRSVVEIPRLICRVLLIKNWCRLRALQHSRLMTLIRWTKLTGTGFVCFKLLVIWFFLLAPPFSYVVCVSREPTDLLRKQRLPYASVDL